MKGNAKYYNELRGYIEELPIIDCHDHSDVCKPKYIDPVQVVVNGYFTSDIQSASSDRDIQIINDYSLSLEERWPVLKKAWDRTCYTGYAKVTKLVLKKFYNEEDLTLEALKRMKNKLLDLENEKTFKKILDEARIAARIENITEIDYRQIADRSYKLSPYARLTIPLPAYHAVTSYEAVERIASPLGRRITSLDEYIDLCFDIFKAYKDYGAVAFKDQSAYQRSLAYGNPVKAGAEKIFNRFMEDPRRIESYPDGIRPLDDYLFHEFMRMARDLKLPVQIHTGHMAGIRNDIVKTNAVNLTGIIELHRDVRFDLFHANWPYSGELLYLCKNYPNVSIDFCWANIIDPVYCQNMIKQAISSVPHGKIHGYGSDFVGAADRAWAHSVIARDNIAIALSDLVEMEYLTAADAKKIAFDLLFNNANEFFNLKIKV
ncbi:MAG: amidohydrolase family protein [Spirochaetes bacterium]|nr:amidohydrolase family protein [Spirochaetota bacterium]